VHSVITSRDGSEGEFKIRGTARAENDPAVQRRYADTAAANLGWDPQPGRSHLFTVDISQLTFISYDPATETSTWPCGHQAGSSFAGLPPRPAWETPRR
jgi:hypothetical protein